jgi:hypothetical protein
VEGLRFSYPGTGSGRKEGYDDMLRYFFLLLLVFASKTMAQAANLPGPTSNQANLGGVSVKLPPPAGFCDLSDSNPDDTDMLSSMRYLASKEGDKLLSMSADCKQLADWRADRGLLDDYAEYLASVARINGAPDKTIKEACAELRADGSKIMSNERQDLNARIAALLKKVKINELASIGVLDEERHACYVGRIGKLRTEEGSYKTVLTLIALTAVKNRRVFLERFMIHTGPGTIDTGLAKLKRDVAAFYAAN